MSNKKTLKLKSIAILIVAMTMLSYNSTKKENLYWKVHTNED